jgi:hypothetical protein
MASRKTVKLGLLAVFISLMLIFSLVGFRHAGRWLTVEDSLSKADIIFVLSGGLPYRAQEAGKSLA